MQLNCPVQQGLRVAAPPQKPLMIFDGECGFCTLWIQRWNQATGDRVDYLPSQDPSLSKKFPELPLEIFNESVQLVETDGEVYRGAEAAFRALTYAPKKQWLLRIYQKLSLFAGFTEFIYRIVARNRTFFSLLTRLGWGKHVEAPSYFLTRSLFLRLLGIIYFIAFVSLWTQVDGLIGASGILPAADLMPQLHNYAAQQNIGASRFQIFPTLCWFNASDGFLYIQCAAGVVLAILLIIGIAPILSLALLWLLYLSLSTVSQDFLSFQWDTLLLETGFLAIFLAPRQWMPMQVRSDNTRTSPSRPPLLAIWLLRWLLFRLMFESGVVKLISGDQTWRNWTALSFHYETQPLPTWLGWHAHHLPFWFHKFSTGMMFTIELIIPFFIFLPRRPRMFAALAFIALELLIASTGNYTFFNLLTIALCVLLFDDFTLRRIPEIFKGRAGSPLPAAARLQPTPWRARSDAPCHLRAISFAALAAVIFFVTLMQLVTMLRGKISGGPVYATIASWIDPFRTINRYGLFAVMTTSRPEIIIEGSNDGKAWLAYEFKYKAGDLMRPPEFVAPHQPRLDWQMWFEALRAERELKQVQAGKRGADVSRWFINFCQRLMEGSPPVLELLDKNPFPNAPPKFVRAQLYDYKFTTAEERSKTGNWWRRNLVGSYTPAMSLPPGTNKEQSQ